MTAMEICSRLLRIGCCCDWLPGFAQRLAVAGLAVAVAALIAVSGCGPARGSVSGQHTGGQLRKLLEVQSQMEMDPSFDRVRVNQAEDDVRSYIRAHGETAFSELVFVTKYDPDGSIAGAAASYLGEYPDPRSIDALLFCLESRSADTREDAIARIESGFGLLDKARHGQLFDRKARVHDVAVRSLESGPIYPFMAADILGALKMKSDVGVLTRALKDAARIRRTKSGPKLLRVAASKALIAIGTKEALQAVRAEAEVLRKQPDTRAQGEELGALLEDAAKARRKGLEKAGG